MPEKESHVVTLLPSTSLFRPVVVGNSSTTESAPVPTSELPTSDGCSKTDKEDVDSTPRPEVQNAGKKIPNNPLQFTTISELIPNALAKTAASIWNAGRDGLLRRASQSLSAKENELVQGYRHKYFAVRRKSLLLTKDWRIYNSRMYMYEKKKKQGITIPKPVPPKPTPMVPIIEDANFSGMDNATVISATPVYPTSDWSANTNIIVRRFVGNSEVPYDPNRNTYPAPDAPPSFSLVAVGTWASWDVITHSYSRIFFITHLQRRWQGDLSIVLFGTDTEEAKFLSYLSARTYEPRVSIVLYLVRNGTKEASVFPINKLRNIGIRNMRTTHYVVFDFDIWPASGRARSA